MILKFRIWRWADYSSGPNVINMVLVREMWGNHREEEDIMMETEIGVM